MTTGKPFNHTVCRKHGRKNLPLTGGNLSPSALALPCCELLLLLRWTFLCLNHAVPSGRKKRVTQRNQNTFVSFHFPLQPVPSCLMWSDLFRCVFLSICTEGCNYGPSMSPLRSSSSHPLFLPIFIYFKWWKTFAAGTHDAPVAVFPRFFHPWMRIRSPPIASRRGHRVPPGLDKRKHSRTHKRS